MRLLPCCLLTIALIAAPALPAFAAPIAVGQRPAPPLTFTQLLQAPDGAKTDWPSLRGKVVVLEFWATWCAGCIENIPHLNALIDSIGPANIQFIAVDDEDPTLVKKFTNKIPIKGWLGLDTTKKIIEAYSAEVRPRTVVIDTQGRIAAILNPEQLNREQLLALADGKHVVFPADSMAPMREKALAEAKAAMDATNAASKSAGPKPLFDLSIRPGDPKGQISFITGAGKNDTSFRFDVTNAPLSMLFQVAGSLSPSRLTINGPADARYSVHISAPSGDLAQFAPAIQLALASAAGAKLIHVVEERDAWVLQATPKASVLLAHTISDHGSMCFYDRNSAKFLMVKTSLDTLASTLEGVLHAPVVNESNLTGEFDATFDLQKTDPASIKAALETNLGLTLVKAPRKIDRVVLDIPPTAPPSAPSPTPEQKAQSASVPGQTMQTIAVPR